MWVARIGGKWYDVICEKVGMRIPHCVRNDSACFVILSVSEESPTLEILHFVQDDIQTQFVILNGMQWSEESVFLVKFQAGGLK